MFFEVQVGVLPDLESTDPIDMNNEADLKWITGRFRATAYIGMLIDNEKPLHSRLLIDGYAGFPCKESVEDVESKVIEALASDEYAS